MTNSWKQKTIKELGKVQTGSTPKTSQKDNFGDYIPFIKPGDFLPNGSLNYDNQRLSKLGLEQSRLISKNSVLMVCIGATIGKVGFTEIDVTTNQQVNSLTPFSEYDTKFIFYQMLTKAFQKKIKNEAGQATLPIINKSKWSDLSLIFPPIEEQKRIVEILDKAFEGIAQAEANTRRNLANTRQIFDVFLNQIFINKGKNWEQITLDKICSIESKLIDPRKNDFINLYHIGAANIVSRTGELIELKTAREEQLISGKFMFDDQMVLYSKIRPYLMKCCRPSFIGLCSADIYPLMPNKNLVSRDYLYYLLLTKDFTTYAISGSDRAGIPKVNRPHLFRYKFFLPPLQFQTEIVKSFDNLAQKTQKLETIYQRKLEAIAELKQSILEKAFTGQLSQ